MDEPFLVVIALVALSLYIPISRGRPRYFCDIPIDHRVPFVPIFVIPYLALFPFFIAALVFLYQSAVAVEFYTSLAIVGVLYAVVSPVISCGAPRANAKGPGILRALVRLVYRLDGKYNNAVFPSTHVYLATICGYFFTLAFPLYALFWWTVALLIAASTVFIKQHNLMDIGGGVMWAATAIYISGLLLPFIS